MMNKLQQYYQCFITLVFSQPKSMGFLGFMLIFVMMAIYKSTPPFVNEVFELNIQKNRVAIRDVYQKRDISNTKQIWVDKLMLKDGANLVHPKLGKIGFSDTFFIDIESDFRVKRSGVYYLIPGSDDGFVLEVDGAKLCDYAGDRPYATRRCRIELSKGNHSFKMSYYQGGGHAGLTLAYQADGDRKKRWFGENSKYMTFH